MRESGRNLMFSYGGETESARNLNFEGGSLGLFRMKLDIVGTVFGLIN